MDSPPRKRRRTSPRLGHMSVNAGHEVAPAAAAASTSLPASVSASTSTAPPRQTSPSRPKRPSFASPTRASLARHNPDILQRRRSVPRGEDNGRVEASRLGAPGQTDASLPTRSPGSQSDPPRRTPIKPNPRPLPPPDPQRSIDVLQPLIALDKRRAGLDMFHGGEELPEPELPPTPERPDPEMAMPPSGIHKSNKNNSHSHHANKGKRPGRRKSRNKKAKASGESPLKQPPMNAKKRSREQELAAAAETDESAEKNAHAVRGIGHVDPDAVKKAERAALLAEIAQLEADVALVAAENERIREAAVRRTEVAPASNRQDLLRFLRRHVLPPQEEAPNQAEAWLKAATNPMAFLPFGRASADLGELLTFGPAATDDDDTTEEPLPISHHPLPMTVAEELPFLQAFSPLSLQSAVMVLSPDPNEPDAPLLQRHLITATATSPPGFMLGRIEMTVHTRSLRITELRVPCLDPAAAPELQPLVDRVAVRSHREAGSALVRNVTVLAWAMGEWVRVAVRRAQLWCALERLVHDKATFRAGLQALRKRKRTHDHGDNHSDEEDDNEDNDELGDNAPRSGSRPIAAAELRAQMGRTAMDVNVPSLSDADADENEVATVRLQWHIGFDWTGEAQSEIGLLLGVPGKWHKADDRGRLAGLPKLFDQLLHSTEDPETAIKTVVALLVGET